MTSFAINTILDKAENRDKDFRYMAANDLLNELQKEAFKPDTEGEKKICRTIVKLLNDQSSDVQSLAVKCLPPLVRKAHQEQVDEIMVTLCDRVLKDEQRDISSIGLKTIVLEMPKAQSMPPTAVRQLTHKLVSGVKKDQLEIKLECMDILNDLLKRFGAVLREEESKECLDALLLQLGSARPAARKRAIACIASISAGLSDKQLAHLVDAIVSTVDGNVSLRRTYIQTLSAICRSGAYRLGKHLDLVVPVVLAQCSTRGSEESPGKGTNDVEALESCLHALESFMLRWPKEVTAFQSDIADKSLEFLKFDPNYADDDDMDGDDECGQGDEEDEEDEYYSDDDDTSWKVRRAAAKLLSAIVGSRADRLADANFFPDVLKRVSARFQEREENVRMDVFATMNELLAQVSAARSVSSSGDGDAMAVDGDASTPAAMLLREVPVVVKAASRQLKEKSVKTRIAAFTCLRNLVATLPGCLSDHSDLREVLVREVVKALKDASKDCNNLRIEALSFLQLALSSHAPTIFQPHVAALLPSVIAQVNERYYKLTAMGLRVCSEVVRVLRPDPPAATFDFKPHVEALFTCAKSRLTKQDQEQEVKECAISCTSLIICHMGDACAAGLPEVLEALLDRLRNEVTRITTVKQFAAIADSRLNLPLAPRLPEVVGELRSFLRKANRPLRQATLATLATIFSSHPAALSEEDVVAVLDELPSLVCDTDLHVAHLSLTLCTKIVHGVPKAAWVPKVRGSVFPRAKELLKSPLLQGIALRSLLGLFTALVKEPTELSHEWLSAQLLSLKLAELTRSSVAALSKALAVCCVHAVDTKWRDGMVETFTAQLGGADVEQIALSLLVLGEIGRVVDLSPHRELLGKVMATFASPADEVKIAASSALGNIAAGNLAIYLPVLLAEMTPATPHPEYLLHALKQMIGSAQAQLAPFVDRILPSLFAFGEHDKEGVRNIVGECLGKLSAVAPEVMPALRDKLASGGSAFSRAVVVNSLRFTITDLGSAPLPPALDAATLLKFLSAIGDPDLKVRRGAVLALNCICHYKPAAIRDELPELLPILYLETRKNPDLVHQVDLGPFKHTVDEGLELRKASFECIDTLLDTAPDTLDLAQFVSLPGGGGLIDGLKDDNDIKMLCHLMLSKLAAIPASQPVLVERLNGLAEPLRQTVVATVKENAVKQQVEKHDDLVRSGMRAVRSIEKLVDYEASEKFTTLVRDTLRGPKLSEKYETVCREGDVKTDVADA